MAHGVRTIVLVVTMTVTVIAVSPSVSAAADLGGLLGGLLGGGSQPTQPAPSQPPPSQPPASGGSPPPATVGSPPADLSAGQAKDPLLAPESSCRGESDPSLPAGAQERAMACMLSYARVAESLP